MRLDRDLYTKAGAAALKYGLGFRGGGFRARQLHHLDFARCKRPAQRGIDAEAARVREQARERSKERSHLGDGRNVRGNSRPVCSGSNSAERFEKSLARALIPSNRGLQAVRNGGGLARI